jgi:hypothetical protein
MKKYQIIIMITAFLSLFEIMNILPTNLPIFYTQKVFMLSLVILEFITPAQIWSRKKTHNLSESLTQTWSLEHEEKKW